MAVLNISLVTDYDSGVVADTEAVTAHSVLEVFKKNSANARKVVLDIIKELPKDLSTLSTRPSLAFTRGDGHAATDMDVRIFE
jgi:5'-methylthioadenosine phosphorylase